MEYSQPVSSALARHEYWSGLPASLEFPIPGDLPHPVIELHLFYLLHWQVDSLPLHPLGSPYFIQQELNSWGGGQ